MPNDILQNGIKWGAYPQGDILAWKDVLFWVDPNTSILHYQASDGWHSLSLAALTDARFTSIAWRAVSGTSDTPVLADAGGGVSLESADPTAVSLPQNSAVAFPVGTILHYRQLGAGLVTMAAGSGATVHALIGLKSAGQYARFRAEKTATNTWLVSGDLAA